MNLLNHLKSLYPKLGRDEIILSVCGSLNISYSTALIYLYRPLVAFPEHKLNTVISGLEVKNGSN